MTEYARDVQPKGFSVSEGHGQSTEVIGYLLSNRPWNKASEKAKLWYNLYEAPQRYGRWCESLYRRATGNG